MLCQLKSDARQAESAPQKAASMERTIRVLNSLVRDGILGRYAIGGAMGAMFYIEPVLTFDLDVFAVLPQQSGLVTLAPVYEELKSRGYAEQGECMVVEGMPVQFLPAYNSLLEEALADAVEMPCGIESARVFRAEHLVAVCLQTGRQKDRDRVRLLEQEASLDRELLQSILRRHQLEGRWAEWTA